MEFCLQVNGHDMTVVTHKKAVDYIKRRDTLNMIVQRKGMTQTHQLPPQMAPQFQSYNAPGQEMSYRKPEANSGPPNMGQRPQQVRPPPAQMAPQFQSYNDRGRTGPPDNGNPRYDYPPNAGKWG